MSFPGDVVSGVARRRREALLARHDVVGLGVGYRWRRGHRTSEPALMILVERKKPHAELRSHELLPQSIDDVGVDVIEVGDLRLQGSPAGVFVNLAERAQVYDSRRRRVRPAPGG